MYTFPTGSSYPLSVYPVLPFASEIPALVGDLRSVNRRYSLNINEWLLLMAAYEGIRSMIDLGIFHKHERESNENYMRRLRELYGFDYSRSIVDLFTHYLFKKEGKKNIPETLSNNKDWEGFLEDVNFFGDAFNAFMSEQARYASVYGHVGIMVNMPQGDPATEQEAQEKEMRPYLSSYHPPAILDWRHIKDASGKPKLEYLKVRDDDGHYHMWWRNKWQVWHEPLFTDKETIETQSKMTAELVAEGVNRLGEIPFVWLFNIRGRIWPIGVSDIHGVARLDRSIAVNLSQGEEIINYGAFPMMRKPMVEIGRETADIVGPTAILEFDPANPNSKPDWLRAVVAEPIGAILQWIERKATEIYRASNTGGMSVTQGSTDAKSGAALSAEFQILNSKITSKAINVENAEREIVYFWLRWMNLEGMYDEISIERPRDFDVSNLAQDLANVLTAKTAVTSKLFKQALEKQVARSMLPSADDKLLADIDAEIEAGPPELPMMAGMPGGMPMENEMDNAKNTAKEGADEDVEVKKATPKAKQPKAKPKDVANG